MNHSGCGCRIMAQLHMSLKIYKWELSASLLVGHLCGEDINKL